MTPLRDTYKRIICISIFSILRTSLSVFADTPQKVSPGNWSCTRPIVSQHYTDGLRVRKDWGKPLLLDCNLYAPSSQIKKQFPPDTTESDTRTWTQQSLHSIANWSFQLIWEKRACLTFSFLLIVAFWYKLRSSERSVKCQHWLAELTAGESEIPASSDSFCQMNRLKAQQDRW